MTRRLRALGAFFSIWIAAGCASAPVTPAGPTLEGKLARLMKLEDERSLGGGEVEARLGDPAGRVRGQAALVRARIGGPGAALEIAPLLDDASPYVRATAAFALGLLEDVELPREAIGRLTELLDDASERVRARAMEALGKKGDPSSAEAIATTLLARMPKGGEPYQWNDDVQASALSYPHFDLRLGLFALARLDSLRYGWGILATQGSTPRFAWWPAAWTATALTGDELAPILRFYAGSRNPEFRYWGAKGLRSISSEQAQDYIRLLIADPNESVRIEAIRAATAHRLHARADDLVPLLDRDTRYVQTEVLKALAELHAEAAIEPLIDGLGSTSPWIRALTLGALARQDTNGFWLLLAGLGQDEHWQVRAALADLLGRLAGDRSVALLRTMVDEMDPRVRARALTALTTRDPDGAVTILIQHLTAEDAFERLAAARGLAALSARDALEPVKQAFLVESSEEPRVKAELLAALAQLDAAEAESIAREALDDTNYLVRIRAASILRRGGSTNVQVLARPSQQGLATYEPYVSPAYSPQAFMRTSRGTIELELFVLDAPLTVRNFVRLARQGFFDGLSFHRVVPNGFVQSGDPRGDGNGGPGYAIRSEINGRPIVRGTLVMADHGKDTAGSQFFITHVPRPDLDGLHTVFGQVTKGMEVVDLIEPSDTIEQVTIWDGFNSPYREP
ncbi:MAG: hypothetical protein E2P02_08655 [Acidobacteria bacterium]|nr:MAG: hypothetical protein E2P02_08655 [Acidobacteriota bacterium]